MDPGEYDESLDSEALNRSISADRARDPSAHSTGKCAAVNALVPVLHCAPARKSLCCYFPSYFIVSLSVTLTSPLNVRRNSSVAIFLVFPFYISKLIISCTNCYHCNYFVLLSPAVLH